MKSPNAGAGADRPEKIVSALCVLLLAVAMFLSYHNQRLFDDIARLEREHLDRDGVIGWVRLDPETKQLFFVRR
ncbi:MAG: hypothetical protein KKA28_19335 [Planctomycetes bacterium]|nr:hypothetical protein [Planctomycetota bacterium]